MTKTIKIGKSVLQVNPVQSPYVPQSNSFVENGNLVEMLSYGIEENLPVLLVGDTGTGKTSAVRYLAKETNNSFRRLNLNGQTTVDEFVGKILVNEKGTYWTDGILTDALRNGHWLLLDEINAALPEILFVLQSLLDDDRYIVLSDKPEERDALGNITCPGSEIVRPHENFRLFASMNGGDGYSGTKDLNKALMSRFPIVLEVNYPDEEKEWQIVKSRFPKSDEYEVKKVIQFGNELRETYKAQELDFIFSTRELLNWVRINSYFKSWGKSAEVCVLGKCNDEDKEKVRSLIKIHFANETTKPTELAVGDEFILFKDTHIYNTNKVFMGKSSLKVLEIKPGLSYIKVEVMGTPKEAQNNATTYGVKGQNWAVKMDDLVGNFQLKKRTK